MVFLMLVKVELCGDKIRGDSLQRATIFFGGKNSVLYKACFKRLNAYLCRCLEVNTLPQVTKHPDYLS